MYVSVLEYVLVRLGFGAVRLGLRAVGLLIQTVVWASAMLTHLVLRSLMREFAHALRRLWAHWQLAKRSTPRVPSVPQGGHA